MFRASLWPSAAPPDGLCVFVCVCVYAPVNIFISIVAQMAVCKVKVVNIVTKKSVEYVLI